MTSLERDRWETLWRSIPGAVSLGEEAQLWFNVLANNYAEPHRSYHTARHIAECLEEFDRSRHLAGDPVAVEIAIWFHDAIYDTHTHDNEEKSAALAVECLQAAHAASSLKSAVRDLVLVTKTHAAEAIPDASLLIDIDLSILGQPSERFWEYESQVRFEYAWVPHKDFAAGRAAIIERFLGRHRLYTTDIFFERYEKRARSNLLASLERLKSEA